MASKLIQERIEQRQKNLERARDGYLDMASKYPHVVEVIDANGTVEEVHQQLTLSVVKFLTDTVRYN